MNVVTRFAPSPTGDLHIGGIRTAIFNWLYAKKHNGQFKLRIEDTDQERSTPEATQHILDSMDWIGLTYDGSPVYQSSLARRHTQVAHAMVDSGHAYRDYTSKEAMDEMRAAHIATGSKAPFKYDNPWRDAEGAYPPGFGYTIRIKSPKTGTTTINDLVQGSVTVDNSTLDDFVIMRSDGTPTYMLSVVVDDHDMGVTHVIRGDDHLNNAFRQLAIYNAMCWDIPQYAHIPLIHGEDGKKLSKRHGAAGIDFYKNIGMIPDAMFSYLMRLGWGHGDAENITVDQALEWFDIIDVNRSPARIDMKKMTNVNFNIMSATNDSVLFDMVKPLVENKLNISLTLDQDATLMKLIPELKPRSKSIVEMATSSLFLFKDDIVWGEKEKNKFNPDVISDVLSNIDSILWTVDDIHNYLLGWSVTREDKFANIVQPVRIAITGSTMSPGIGETMVILGRDETIKRLNASI